MLVLEALCCSQLMGRALAWHGMTGAPAILWWYSSSLSVVTSRTDLSAYQAGDAAQGARTLRTANLCVQSTLRFANMCPHHAFQICISTVAAHVQTLQAGEMALHLFQPYQADQVDTRVKDDGRVD